MFEFIDKIEDFYRKNQEKNILNDDFDRSGYIKFWREWNNRRYF